MLLVERNILNSNQEGPVNHSDRITFCISQRDKCHFFKDQVILLRQCYFVLTCLLVSLIPFITRSSIVQQTCVQR